MYRVTTYWLLHFDDRAGNWQMLCFLVFFFFRFSSFYKIQAILSLLSMYVFNIFSKGKKSNNNLLWIVLRDSFSFFS